MDNTRSQESLANAKVSARLQPCWPKTDFNMK